jgi:membrane-bound serine protease (ClpP class)
VRQPRPLVAALLAGAAASVALAAPQTPEASQAPLVRTVEITGVITGGTAEFVAAALGDADRERVAAVAISLDTPGGQLEATRDIVRAILASPVPVLVWVGPAGARAGSAGVFLTLAADVAAMHPTSNIGAAHPVVGSGQDVEAAGGKDLARKVENDTAAFARSVAEAHGRNAAWAEKAVRESVSATGREALKLRVVDLIAPTLREALDAADGRRVERAGGAVTLRTRGARLEPLEMSLRQQVLSVLGDPNVVALLVLLGTLGLALEFYNPGTIAPGVVGGLCLLVAFLAMRIIPVNAGAALLVVVGVALLVAEAWLPTHGLAALGGAACVVLGMVFFVDRSAADYRFDPGAFSLSPWLVWPTPLAFSAVLGFVGWKVARTRRLPHQAGEAGLLGATGVALSEVGPSGGEVFVHGEYWRARSQATLPRGARVRVTAVEGLTVTVAESPESPTSSP